MLVYLELLTRFIDIYHIARIAYRGSECISSGKHNCAYRGSERTIVSESLLHVSSKVAPSACMYPISLCVLLLLCWC